MAIIRRRVATRGPSTDALAGLGLKAYLVRERGVAGSSVNEYAPFYLWKDPSAMPRFLTGDGFAALVRDFGRPAVHAWTVLGFLRGAAWGASPREATRTASRMPADGPVSVKAALAAVRARAGTAGVVCAVTALDPRRWEIASFTLWADSAPAEDDGARFSVLHLSSPHIGELKVGDLDS
jgi:hypothetical protein